MKKRLKKEMRYNCRTEIMNFISKFDINQLEESSDLI